VFCAYSGFTMIGLNSALLNGILSATPEDKRLVYLAFFNTLTSLSLFIAPLFSHFLHMQIGLFNAFYVLIAGRAVGGCLVWASLRRTRRLREENI
jgi:MFS family permease